MENILILTYPRTGQHLLRSLFHKTDANFDWSHNINNDKFKWKSDSERPFYDGSQKVITIVRDPKDAIASYIVYNIFQEDLDADKIKRSLKLLEASFVNEYVLFWQYMLDITHTYVEYNSLVNNKNKVMNKLSKIFNFKYYEDKPEPLLDYKKHIMSSKEHKEYQNILEEVSRFDLNKCYDIYNICKSKCIRIEE